MEKILYNALFGSEEEKKKAREEIFQKAEEKGIYSSSIKEFYKEMGKDKYFGFTVPAINIRGLTFLVAKQVFKAIKELDVGPVIFEIARSEIGYTEQEPEEYAVNILAAAIDEGYKGPVFLQGDHFQVNAKKFSENKEKEIESLEKLIKKAIDAKFYNIDIDTSTLVDISKSDLLEQQRLNYELCAHFTKFIRENEPKDVSVSIGGEIGEVGGKNSTKEELEAFMDGFLKELPEEYLSKISVQTGTSHGGVVLPDGSIAKVAIDFETLKTLSKVAKEKYGMAGAVQHGASTLPDELFHKFPEVGTAEIHLATAFQNMMFENPKFPEDLKKEMIDYCFKNFISEKKEKDTDEQFFYKTRKKLYGPFKKQLWETPEEFKENYAKELKEKFKFLFKQLRVDKTRKYLEEVY
jgi:fructose/tagatose bisphosphate aldolase